MNPPQLNAMVVMLDARLTETERRVLLTGVEQAMLGVDAFREVKLAPLGAELSLSRSAICRALDGLVGAGYLERDVEAPSRAPQRYRLRISAFFPGT